MRYQLFMQLNEYCYYGNGFDDYLDAAIAAKEINDLSFKHGLPMFCSVSQIGE